MKNLSKKKQMVTYTDSTTGERKTEVAEVYLPLVISPLDWLFDNDVFSNVKTDPTGIISYLPTDFQLTWSIPLFPPATDADNTIWMEADAKNLSMKPLSLTCAYIFPKTNQKDPIPEFQSSLAQLYSGVEQLGAGLGQAVTGLGSSGMSNTLIWGIGQISGGLQQMASPTEGLPFAESTIRTQFIPGAQELFAGLGSAETPDTLLYGTNQISGGLEQLSAAIGTINTPDTLLYGANAIKGGLETVQALVGPATTPGTLLNGLGQLRTGLTNPGATALADYGLLEALTYVAAQLPKMVTGTAPEIIWDPVMPYPGNIYTALWGINYLVQSDPGGGSFQKSTINTIINGPGGLVEQICTLPNQESIHDAASFLVDNLGSTTTPGTMLNGVAQLVGGVDQLTAGGMQLNAAIGSATTGGTLLYAANAVIGGLNQLKGGIGSATTPDTLLYGANAIYGGLSQIKGSVSTGSAANPGLLEGLQQLDSGLAEAVTGLGSTSNSQSLIGGTSGINDGLNQLKDGLVQATTQGTDVMLVAMGEGLKELDLTVGELEAIAQRGEKFDTYLGRVKNPGSTSDIRFLLQTKPVQNPNKTNGWIYALVISLIGAAALVVFGLFAFKKYA
jgi:X-X-X-Leu-X-X-Gly heptad repeat protein